MVCQFSGPPCICGCSVVCLYFYSEQILMKYMNTVSVPDCTITLYTLYSNKKTRNSSGDEIPERDIDAVRHVASLLIAHTAVANSSSPRSRGEYNKRCPKSGPRNSIRGHPRGPKWYHWILQIWFPISHELYPRPYLVPFVRHSLRYVHHRSILLYPSCV